ncbi:MAG: CopL family metal-binding regulatory protein, partial [Lysobacter sp.]
TYPSLLLRLLLIVALSLNGYAAASMAAGGGHAMFMGKSTPLTTSSPAQSLAAMSADCHEDMASMGNDADAALAQHPAPSAPEPGKHPGQPDPAQHGDDCCGKFRCQCDCLQAVAIVRIALPVPPQLSNAPLALPRETDAPLGVSSLPIRPPIA